MQRSSFQSPSGTQDLLSPDAERRQLLIQLFSVEASRAGFGQVVPPMFEQAEVFHRLGEASDVVSKELYDFTDRGGRQLALRPEFTASVCRVFIQHRPLTPWKVWYSGPSFRQERPQKGRYRQFDQVGSEVLGSTDPDVDVELISLCWRFFRRLGLTGVTLLLNSLGDSKDRSRYIEALVSYFKNHLGDLSEQSQTTLEINPLRVLDSKRPLDQAVIADAPVLIDYLGDKAAASFARVQAGLLALGIPFTLAPLLVRGLDYYNRTIFEFAATSLDAAQNAVGGGGRYDGLVADLGGVDQPGAGFALGVDRLLLACDAEGVFPVEPQSVQVWVVAVTSGTEGVEVAAELRDAGLTVNRTFDGRSMKAQMKAANKAGAEVAVIIGESEVASGSVSVRCLQGSFKELREESSGTQQVLVQRSEMVERVRSVLS